MFFLFFYQISHSLWHKGDRCCKAEEIGAWLFFGQLTNGPTPLETGGYGDVCRSIGEGGVNLA